MEKLDFKATAEAVERLSPRAQATFFFVLVGVLKPGVLRTLVTYALRRIDSLNYQLPDDHPKKEFYLNRKNRNGKKPSVPNRRAMEHRLGDSRPPHEAMRDPHEFYLETQGKTWITGQNYAKLNKLPEDQQWGVMKNISKQEQKW